MQFEASPITDGIVDATKGLLRNPVATAIGGAVIGSAVAGAAVYGATRASSSRRRATRKKSASVRRSRKKRSYKYARTAGKAKDRSTRRIRMTKNGQPYVILKSGKARFIKKSSARLSRKRKGGRY